MMPPQGSMLALLLLHTALAAPNATKSFFPTEAASSSPSNVEITQSNADPYMAQASDFFPSNSGLKFPSTQQQEQEEPRVSNNGQQQTTESFGLILPLDTSGSDFASDEVAANEAIDIILRSARSGKSMDLSNGKDGDDLAKVANDPIIQEQLANGNEVEARGYIRNKLCGLGLMPVSLNLIQTMTTNL
jgi:hypothetical protein